LEVGVTSSLDNVAENVKVLRIKRKMTQTGLAELSKVSINTICVLEQKRGHPSWTTICLLADALGVEPITLIKRPAHAAA